MQMAAEETETHLNPLAVLHALEKVLPDNAILVADGGDFVGSAAYILKPRRPLSWLDPGAFGTLGVGGGFALGAKLARPDSEVRDRYLLEKSLIIECSSVFKVWIVWGDGSCGYSVAEFDTFTRFKLPVMALVGNDAAWTQILREQVTILGTDVACKLTVTFLKRKKKTCLVFHEYFPSLYYSTRTTM
jgi:acetolactate synthase-like protein